MHGAMGLQAGCLVHDHISIEPQRPHELPGIVSKIRGHVYVLPNGLSPGQFSPRAEADVVLHPFPWLVDDEDGVAVHNLGHVEQVQDFLLRLVRPTLRQIRPIRRKPVDPMALQGQGERPVLEFLLEAAAAA